MGSLINYTNLYLLVSHLILQQIVYIVPTSIWKQELPIQWNLLVNSYLHNVLLAIQRILIMIHARLARWKPFSIFFENRASFCLRSKEFRSWLTHVWNLFTFSLVENLAIAGSG